MTTRPKVRDDEVVPGPCQIVRGTTGNGGDQVAGQSGPVTGQPQVSAGIAPREPELPKLRSLPPPRLRRVIDGRLSAHGPASGGAPWCCQTCATPSGSMPHAQRGRGFRLQEGEGDTAM